MKQQPSNQLVCHISHTFWNIEQSAVRTCLEQYDGEWFKPSDHKPKKHPIELVNKKYPNGWYCEAFDEVKNDLEDATYVSINQKFKYVGMDENNCLLTLIYNDENYPFITRTEYISITRQKEVEQWQPTKGEQVEVSNDCYNWVSGEYIGISNDEYWINNQPIPFTYIRQIQINPTKKNLDIKPIINGDMKDHKIESLKEDIECVHLYLDNLGIPRENKVDTYSIVGRIKVLETFIKEVWSQKVNTVSEDSNTSTLTAEDLVIGSKYVPISKSKGCSFEYSEFIQKQLKYIYYFGKVNNAYIFQEIIGNNHDREIYLPSDVIPYIEEPIIHVQQPNILEDRIKALEDKLFAKEIAIDWRQIECLSFNDFVNISNSCKINLCDVNDKDDVKLLEEFIKKRLNL